jgi:hypothetical protein
MRAAALLSHVMDPELWHGTPGSNCRLVAVAARIGRQGRETRGRRGAYTAASAGLGAPRSHAAPAGLGAPRSHAAPAGLGAPRSHAAAAALKRGAQSVGDAGGCSVSRGQDGTCSGRQQTAQRKKQRGLRHQSKKPQRSDACRSRPWHTCSVRAQPCGAATPGRAAAAQTPAAPQGFAA